MLSGRYRTSPPSTGSMSSSARTSLVLSTISKAEALAKAVELYANDFRWGTSDITPEEVRAELAGKDLACWCPLSSPCHADVLLELANAGEPS